MPPDESSIPNPVEDIYLSFSGQINMDTVRGFFVNLSAATDMKGAKRMHLLIHSTGGFINDGFALYNFLKGFPLEVITYNVGMVASIAVIPYLAGTVRKASANAIFLVHKGTFSFMGPVNAETIVMRAEALKRDDAIIEDVLRSSINMPDDKWAVHAVHDLIITAQEALEFAFIHKIEDWKIPTGCRSYAF